MPIICNIYIDHLHMHSVFHVCTGTMNIHCIYMKPQYIHTHICRSSMSIHIYTIHTVHMHACMHACITYIFPLIHLPFQPPFHFCLYTPCHGVGGDPLNAPKLYCPHWILCLSLGREPLAILRTIDCCTDPTERT